jgi:putative ABC transport system permease protein
MDSLIEDVRVGFRSLLRQPGFTIVAASMLALGIGANSALFSVIDAALLRPLPYPAAEQLVRFNKTDLNGSSAGSSVAAPTISDWREHSDTFAAIAGYQRRGMNLQSPDAVERIRGAAVSPELFAVLDVRPQRGRSFALDEAVPQGHHEVILGQSLWRRSYGADPQIVGKRIAVDGETFSVVGVMPSGFEFPERAELWIPLVPTPEQAQERRNHAFKAIGRLAPGVTLERAQQQLNAIAVRLGEQYPSEREERVRLGSLHDDTAQNLRPALYLLLGAVGLVLLIACGNVANLLLARSAERSREMAVRQALGADRGQMLRQVLTESVLLALLGGALGLWLASLVLDLLLGVIGPMLPAASALGLDARTLAFTLALSLGTGIVFGIAPALQGAGADALAALRGGEAAGSPAAERLRSGLVVAEVALSLILLIGAGLLIQSFMRLQRVDAGVRTENVVVMQLPLTPSKYATAEAVAAFWTRLLERLSALPGVRAAAANSYVPVQSSGANVDFEIEGAAPAPSDSEPLAEIRVTTPDFFRAMGIPLVSGRFFDAQDRPEGEPVVLINQALARQQLGGADPLGRHVDVLGTKWRIVGVVGDVRQAGLGHEALPEISFPLTQLRMPMLIGPLMQSMSLIVQTKSAPLEIVPQIRAVVRELDPAQPLDGVQTMEMVIARSLADRRLSAISLGSFAIVALVISLIGIYGVISYSVARRTREIGVRIALGASQGDIIGAVLRQGLGLTAIGVLLGNAGAFALTRAIGSLLHGIDAAAPFTFGAVSALFVSVAALACFIPAYRATRVDPLISLRAE